MLGSWRSVNAQKYFMALRNHPLSKCKSSFAMLLPGTEGISEDAQENTPCWNRLADKGSQHRTRAKVCASAPLCALDISAKWGLRALLTDEETEAQTDQ